MLPIEAALPELLDTLERNSTVLLQAPTGSGKTTGVPPALLDVDWRQGRRILMLEPRRLAARSAARYMARQRGESPGQRIGYRTRLDTQVSRETIVEVVTEGILTRLIQSDPALGEYAAVLFDEFHERSLQADLGLALVRESQQALRPDLRVLIMSATLATETLAELLDDCPVITSEGRSFEVGVRYRPAGRERPEIHVARVVRAALAEAEGSALVFLPGLGEIRRVARRLADPLPDDVDLHILHGSLAANEQDAAIEPAPAGRRKIVLASAIAESSLTIEGIRIVVDAGWQRRARFDPNSGMTRLVTERVSKASAEQRRGRAGRLAPGVCYRLWSESERLQAHTPPEILSADLAPVVLELAQWGVTDPQELDWLDPPPEAPWQQARELLRQLGALDGEGRITTHGREMLAPGLHPSLAHMVLMGRKIGLGRTAAELAALLGERDPTGVKDADVETRLATLRARSRSGDAMTGIRRMAGQIAAGWSDTAPRDGAAGRLLAQAWPDRIGQRRGGQRGRFRLANGRGAFLPEDDPLAGSEWLVACDLDGQAREARIYLAAAVSQADLEHDLAARIETLEIADWDEQRGTIVARRQRRLGTLVLDETELDRPNAEMLQAGLLAAIRRKGIDALPWTEKTRQWQARVDLLRRLWPDQWPAVDDAALEASLEDWLLPWLAGFRRWSDLERLDLSGALKSLIGYPQQQRLDQLAPTKLVLPTGRSARLDYCQENPPVLAVKLQALFGWQQTPRIADNRVAVQLQLLSPAGRPLAVTADLASFWQNAYPDVRKDMRGRYPKHPWPEDPLKATATEATRRTR